MADEMPSLHIDTDWKKQAQEEKRKLAEAEAAKKAEPAVKATAEAGGMAAPGAAASSRGGSTRGGVREMPPASVATLVQSLMTQALYYLGELNTGGAEPMMNLDVAKHQIDTLAVLDEKMKGNLSPDEQQLLDSALYETRMRFVSVASQLT